MDQSTTKKLYRSRQNRIIAGICGGMGEYLGIDPLIVRIIFVLLILFHGAGLLLYLILAIFIPLAPGAPLEASSEEKIEEFFSGTKAKVENLANEVRTEKDWLSNRRNIIGGILLVVGVVALLNQIFPYDWFSWNYIWPAAIIIAALLIMLKK
jgi:phage shock protein C